MREKNRCEYQWSNLDLVFSYEPSHSGHFNKIYLYSLKKHEFYIQNFTGNQTDNFSDHIDNVGDILLKEPKLICPSSTTTVSCQHGQLTKAAVRSPSDWVRWRVFMILVSMSDNSRGNRFGNNILNTWLLLVSAGMSILSCSVRSVRFPVEIDIQSASEVIELAARIVESNSNC